MSLLPLSLYLIVGQNHHFKVAKKGQKSGRLCVVHCLPKIILNISHESLI
jgi:hypothetical protein